MAVVVMNSKILVRQVTEIRTGAGEGLFRPVSNLLFRFSSVNYSTFTYNLRGLFRSFLVTRLVGTFSSLRSTLAVSPATRKLLFYSTFRTIIVAITGRSC